MKRKSRNKGKRKTVRNSWITLKKRWTTNMPSFFKKLSYIAGSLGAAILAFHIAIQEMGGTEPEWFTEYFSTIAGICGGIVGTAKFTRTYNDDSQ